MVENEGAWTFWLHEIPFTGSGFTLNNNVNS